MTALLEQIEADGIRLTVTESGEVRVAGKRSLVERWAPMLRDRKPDLMAALLAREHVNMVNVVSCGDPAAHTMPSSGSIVTVTEPTDAERQAIAYCERIAKEREAGKVPSRYTAITHCCHCGTVPIFAGAPARVGACPWCHNRTRGLPIRRPAVSCATCAHWRRDPTEPYALVSCKHATKARYPRERKPCADYQPGESSSTDKTKGTGL